MSLLPLWLARQVTTRSEAPMATVTEELDTEVPAPTSSTLVSPSTCSSTPSCSTVQCRDVAGLLEGGLAVMEVVKADLSQGRWRCILE